MTLDSAITYYEEIAQECRRKAGIERNDYMDMRDSASEADQLASWLNELKLLRGRIDAQQKPQWIPCSERMPDHNQVCIVTDETGRGTYEYGFHDETYDEVNGWTYLGHKIIAWMPLPEPWKGEQP